MEIMVKRKRAAVYCRVSTGLECQEGSYEIQKSYYTNLLANSPDEELVRVYAEAQTNSLETSLFLLPCRTMRPLRWAISAGRHGQSR